MTGSEDFASRTEAEILFPRRQTILNVWVACHPFLNPIQPFVSKHTVWLKSYLRGGTRQKQFRKSFPHFSKFNHSVGSLAQPLRSNYYVLNANKPAGCVAAHTRLGLLCVVQQVCQ